MTTPPSAARGGEYKFGDRYVRRLGYGAMRLSGPAIMGPPTDPDEAAAVLRRALDAGINHIDTSDFYGPHTVNQLIADTLYPYPPELAIVTKVGARRTPDGDWPPATAPDELRQAVEDNLARLRVDSLYAVNLRMSGPGGDVFRSGSIAEPYGVLVDLQRQGKVRHLGISNVGSDQVHEALSIAPLVCVQNAYNIAHRGDDSLIDELETLGIAYVPFFPLGGFAPLQSQKLAEIAARLDASPMQVALAWLLRRSRNILLIPGTSTRAHLDENLRAADVADRIDAGTLAELNAL
ncbi:oxidoreductase [Tsukamurella sp. 8F]|uniref:oxidoreductase n=1 Tax=unclassified Tsukamurella TaxID=2633480 RepID=UPI0023B902B0|nr:MULTISPECIES: oxidoreductase [unclassified Tsukamurella]MDF0529166.1 oxidoreductase [Tsukamurella sp. 8J]MDF0585351.1 oxidoreductase [Tsukamurella sp. 8F]